MPEDYKKPFKVQDPPKRPPEFAAFAIQPGDVIISRSMYRTIIGAFRTLPCQTREQQIEQTQEIIKVLTAVLGE